MTEPRRLLLLGGTREAVELAQERHAQQGGAHLGIVDHRLDAVDLQLADSYVVEHHRRGANDAVDGLDYLGVLEQAVVEAEPPAVAWRERHVAGAGIHQEADLDAVDLGG